MMRQIGKQILTIAAWLALAGVAWADSLVTTIVTDPLTGVAIDGYDPVSYFVDAEPAAGMPDYEYDWDGVPWYFESAANRDVFARNPAVYAPQFGGHCLMSLSRGYLSDGKPLLYVIDGLRLYFFYSGANRDAFLLSRQAAIDVAAKNWPALAKGLSGPQDGPATALVAATSSSSDTGAASEPSSAAPDSPASAMNATASADASAPALPSVAPASADGNVGATDSASSSPSSGSSAEASNG